MPLNNLTQLYSEYKDNDGYPQYKEGYGKTPRSLQDIFKYSGWLERGSLWEAEQQRKERMKQLKIKRMLQMLNEDPNSFGSKEEIDRILNRESWFM